jgi:hypothetical protein
MKSSYTEQELAEWENGARKARMGVSLSQSYKHIHKYDHDMRNAHKSGWIAMKEYLTLKEIDEELS